MTRRHEFASRDELFDHLAERIGAQRVPGGVRGTGTSRRPGTDPVLEAVTSSEGTLVVGGEPIDVGAGAPAAPADDYLHYTGDVNGAERWASDDGAMVQYRLDGESLTFYAWKKSTLYLYWSMGGEISTEGGTPFAAAQVDSHYYMTLQDQPCQVVRIDSDADHDTDYVDEYEWGWNAPQPERVASLCRAQWKGRRFGDLVTAGDGCDGFASDNWPTGFPADWPPITGFTVVPAGVDMGSVDLGLNTARTITVVNFGPTPLPVTVAPVSGDDFDVAAGDFTVPGDGTLPVEVMFDGGSHAGVFATQVHVVVSGTAFVVPVKVTVTDDGQPK
jgi:hypothetical protein